MHPIFFRFDRSGVPFNEVPGLYFNLGIVPRDEDLPKAAPNHSPGGALLTGGLSSSDRHSSCYARARARTRPALECGRAANLSVTSTA